MKRNKLALIFALVLGLGASLLVWNYTQRLQSQVQEQVQQAEEKVKAEQVTVLVAARDLPVHTKIGPDDVKVIEVSKPSKVDSALDKPDDAIGKVLGYPLASGEQILPTKFATAAPTGMSIVIPPGKRAVSAKVDQVVTAGGLLEPGDHVDVIGTFNADKAGKDESVIFLQNVEVLAIDQAYEGQPSDAVDATQNQQIAKVGVAPQGTSTPVVESVRAPVYPNAKTVTFALGPEEAQRLTLADSVGQLRLAVRAPNDTTASDTVETTISTLRGPVEQPTAEILSVSFSPTTLKAGDTLKVQFTVKNTSDKPIKSQDPKSGFTYVQGQTYFSQNFPSVKDTWRVGVSFDDHASAPFPYRWGWDGDLAPGATTSVTGFVKLTYDFKATNFWAGMLQEPSTVVQDNVGTALITVLPENTAVISVDAANVRSGPDIASSIIGKLNYGTEVPILGQEKDWFKVKLPDGREGFVAAGWIIAPQTPSPPPPAPAAKH
jgi:pilus assembly protein CpaB